MSEKYERAMLQDEREISWLVKQLLRNNVRSYLEVGCKFGGALWFVATRLPTGSRIVAVDLPQGDGSFKEAEPHLRSCVKALSARGYDAHLIIGDSTDAAVIKQATALGPFDACFIDANHTEPYVRADWANYGAQSRMVAFHDIAWKLKPTRKMDIHVPQVWAELKQQYKHRECAYSAADNGIGVLWRF